MASTAVRTSLTAETMMTAIRSSRARICGRKVGPGGPGMRTSSRTTSTRRERSTSSPLAPRSASRTSNSPSKMTRKDSRTPCSSSMTRATGLGRGASALMASGLVWDLEDGILAADSHPLDLYGDSLARLERSHRVLELRNAADPAAIDLEKHVAFPDTGRLGRAAGGDVRNHDTGAPAQPVRSRHLLTERLDRHPEALALRSRRQHRLLSRLLPDLDRELGRLAIAQHGQGAGAPGRDGGHALLEVGHLLDQRAAQIDDDVARLHAGGLGRAVLQHVGHQDPALAGNPEPGGELIGQVLDGDAEPAAHHPPVRDQLGHDFAGHVDR